MAIRTGEGVQQDLFGRTPIPEQSVTGPVDVPTVPLEEQLEGIQVIGLDTAKQLRVRGRAQRVCREAALVIHRFRSSGRFDPRVRAHPLPHHADTRSSVQRFIVHRRSIREDLICGNLAVSLPR